MKVASCLCLLAVVVAVTAAPSDPAVVVHHVSPTFHSDSDSGFNGSAEEYDTYDDEPAYDDPAHDEHIVGGSQHTIIGAEDYSISSSPDHGSFGKRSTETSDEHDDDEHDTDTSEHTPSHSSSVIPGIPIPHILHDGSAPRAEAQVGHPSVFTHSVSSVEETTEHDEETEESHETESSEGHSQIQPSDTWIWPQEEQEVSLRNFDFHPITFPRHDPPSFQPGALSAAYTLNRLDQDAEEVPLDSGERPAPDLSRDTAVNYLPADRQGMVMVDPDAEIIDLNSVVEKSNDLEFS
ncbi:uncharacterized protein LOC122248161 [Penaeus japonicus]|uniref:uncharacterized protein LOC122248161 n=1 Tax=Penaeus japonicus TaxID=27405 RepID=UPI001C70EB5E|nr:uncharacterized protein LOC122248161 [Penaeus japonicus]